jgi:hypothetical protein
LEDIFCSAVHPNHDPVATSLDRIAQDGIGNLRPDRRNTARTGNPRCEFINYN